MTASERRSLLRTVGATRRFMAALRRAMGAIGITPTTELAYAQTVVIGIEHTINHHPITREEVPHDEA